MKYSQNNEEEIILKYFEGQKLGTYLDIGAYDPEVFSNTRALYELGWRGVLVEPADMNFDVLKKYFEKDNAMQLVKICIGTYNGEIEFMDSGGDAISTTVPSHAKIWADGYGTKYTTRKSPICTFETLLENSLYNNFDFVSIDTEGTNFEILSQIDFNSISCRLVCVENNGKEEPKYVGYMQRQGFRLLHKNGENLIFGK